MIGDQKVTDHDKRQIRVFLGDLAMFCRPEATVFPRAPTSGRQAGGTPALPITG